MFSHINSSCTCSGKWCSSCGQSKCLGDFNRNRRMNDGLDNYCRACKKAWLEAYRQGDLEPIREQRERAKSSGTYRHKGVVPLFDHVADNCNCPGKRCSSCEQIKCYGAFNHHKSTKGGLQVYCRDCQNVRDRAYYQNNPEPYRQRSKTQSKRVYLKNWRRDHPEYRQAYKKAYMEAHPDYNQTYREANRSKIREHARSYMRNRRMQRVIHEANRQARKRQAGGTFTQEEWESLCAYYNYTCLCCGKREPEIELTVDHIVPLSQGGSNSLGNLQPLCRSCNSRKRTRTIDYRLEWGN